MSTPTPIQIVRIYLDAQAEVSKTMPPCATEARINAALAAVLADAERFKALERAHDGVDGWQGWSDWEAYIGRQLMTQPLAELADRLREGAK